jgi:hypothetical protein
MATTSTTIQPGTIIRCPRYISGRSVGTRRAVVLGLFSNDPSRGYAVWYYTAGAAGSDTVGLAYPHEVASVVGDLNALSERTLRSLDRGARNWRDAHAVRSQASLLHRRMRCARQVR